MTIQTDDFAPPPKRVVSAAPALLWLSYFFP